MDVLPPLDLSYLDSVLLDDVVSDADDVAFPLSPQATLHWLNAMPHAPSPTLHLEPMQSAVTKTVAATAPAAPSRSSKQLAKRDSSAKLQQLAAAAKQQQLTLDDVEREILRHNAHLPPDAKRKMAKAEFRRLKHCETVRQSRVRKKAERKDLRQVNDELEEQLDRALADFRARNDWMHFDESSLRDVLFKKFAHSIYEVRGLRTETTELKDQLMVYDTLGEHFQRLQSDFAIPDYLRFQMPTLLAGAVQCREVSDDEARAIMVDSHREATSFFTGMRQLLGEPGGAGAQEKTMGWAQHQRITPEGCVQFNFTKRIHTIGAAELVDKSWAMYCDFELYHGIYASVQKLEILQRINEDTLLIRRDLQEGSSAPIFRTIFLLFRIKLDNGYLICFRSHNPPGVAADEEDPNVQWMDMFYWLMITDPPAADACAGSSNPWATAAGGCDVTFGGNLLDYKSSQHAVRWKYQIAMALLRWESNAVAPLFALYG
ncbi:hypothetical protein PybrP1_005280 [[Pythium] brassicae (nom. inval.)]|nr:hypothetical protein PybrP1_005280 [[Pythium] brassicae (nom. inval.)]